MGITFQESIWISILLKNGFQTSTNRHPPCGDKGAVFHWHNMGRLIEQSFVVIALVALISTNQWTVTM